MDVERTTETKQDRMRRGALHSQKQGGRGLVKSALQHATKDKTREIIPVIFAQCPLCPANKSAWHGPGKSEFDAFAEVARWAETHTLLHRHRDRLYV